MHFFSFFFPFHQSRRSYTSRHCKGRKEIIDAKGTQWSFSRSVITHTRIHELVSYDNNGNELTRSTRHVCHQNYVMISCS